MRKVYLTLEQNICAARVFLNVFGLILEQSDNIDQFTKIKIFNVNNEEVGILYFQDGKVKLEVNSSFGRLDAEYNLANFSILEDLEFGGAYVDWISEIKFKVSSDNKLNFSGIMNIACSIDTDFGIKCNTHTLLKYKLDEKNVIIKFMLDGSSFKYDIFDDKDREVIDIRPCDEFSGYIIHRIDNGKLSEYSYLYRKYSGIHKKSSQESDILRMLSYVYENGKEIFYESNYVGMNGKSDSSEAIVQKGLLMQRMDSDYVRKLEEIKNIFTFDEVLLFDNLVDISFKSYNDEEVQALFGLERKKIRYQNGADNLLHAYYGVGSDNKFIIKEKGKRLLKKKDNN